jgi:hypothetical protein
MTGYLQRPSGGGGPPVKDVLAALDRGASELEQAIALVGASTNDARTEQLSIGELDRALLALHRRLLSRDVEVTVACGRCASQNTFVLNGSTVPPLAPLSAWLGPGEGLREPRCVDLLGLPDDPHEAARELAARCEIGPQPGPRDPDRLELVDTSLTGRIHGACVDCGGPVSADIDSAHRVVVALTALRAAYDAEVHVIASRYGWSLDVIDALPDARRRRFASLAGASA